MAGPPLQPNHSDTERVKHASRRLRGTIEQSLKDPVTGALSGPGDTSLIKFHGSYQQDDRDLRDERRQQKLEPAYMFMIRTRLPGGVCQPKQWLQLDEIARSYGNNTLRITTRQSFQLHGVVKANLKQTMQDIRACGLDTISACGDVNRNVMCNPNPVESRVHQTIYDWSMRISEHLRPKTRAYFEIWLDDEKLAGEPEEEPIYGATYLPRKFKVGIAVPPLNDIDVYSQDLGLVGIVENDELVGFNVLVGGGMGASHGDPETFPRVGDVIGFVNLERLLTTVQNVVMIQRDFGDRVSRKHARLKYTIQDRGVAWFVEELEKRSGYPLERPRPFKFDHNGDRFGWVEGYDGKWNVTLYLESGRVADVGEKKQLTGLREIAKIHQGDFRLTPNQNLIIARIPPEERPRIEALLAQYQLDGFERASNLRKYALSCVALPTCGLAFAESERYLPRIMDLLEARLAAHGMAGAPLNLRITGCPNGCARPYLAEIALIGKGPGRYNLFLGGDRQGTRLNRLYRENIDEDGIIAALDPLFAAWAKERLPDEDFGDFTVRTFAGQRADAVS